MIAGSPGDPAVLAVIADALADGRVSLSEVAAEMIRRGHLPDVQVASRWVRSWHHQARFVCCLPFDHGCCADGDPAMVCSVSIPQVDGDLWIARLGDPDAPTLGESVEVGAFGSLEEAQAAADDAARARGWVLV